MPKPKFRGILHAVAMGAFNGPQKRGMTLLRQLSGSNGTSIIAPKPPIQRLNNARAKATKTIGKPVWGSSKKSAFARRVEAMQRKNMDSQHHSGPHHTPFVRHPTKLPLPARNSSDK